MSEQAKLLKRGRTSARSSFNRAVRALHKYIDDGAEESLINSIFDEIKQYRSALCYKHDQYTACFNSDDDELSAADNYIEEVELEFRSIEIKVHKCLIKKHSEQMAVQTEQQLAEKALEAEKQNKEVKKKTRVLRGVRQAEIDSLNLEMERALSVKDRKPSMHEVQKIELELKEQFTCE